MCSVLACTGYIVCTSVVLPPYCLAIATAAIVGSDGFSRPPKYCVPMAQICKAACAVIGLKDPGFYST